MIALENIGNYDMYEAIEQNLRELLATNPTYFLEYFKNTYNLNTILKNVSETIFRNKIMGNEFAIEFPDLLYETCKFIIEKSNNYSILKKIPAIFYFICIVDLRLAV